MEKSCKINTGHTAAGLALKPGGRFFHLYRLSSASVCADVRIIRKEEL